MSKWSHLPNAKYIDRIIAHVKVNPTAWDAAYEASRGAAWDAAWDAAWRVAYEASRDVAQDAADDAVVDAAWDAAWDALLALVAWDHASGLMDLPAEQVKVLALLGNQAAILMYPAIKIMETTQELV